MAIASLSMAYVVRCDVLWNHVFCLREKKRIVIAAMLEGVLINIVIAERQGMIQGILLAIFSGTLLFGCITDVVCAQVYRFTWWLAGGSGLIMIGLWLEGGEANMAGLIPLLLFGGLQKWFFAKMYGRADCHAFCACAMVECALGMGLREFLVHMAISLCLLTVVQAFRGNINRRGNLKTPIPFLPYITVGFWALTLVDTLGTMA